MRGRLDLVFPLGQPLFKWQCKHQRAPLSKRDVEHRGIAGHVRGSPPRQRPPGRDESDPRVARIAPAVAPQMLPTLVDLKGIGGFSSHLDVSANGGDLNRFLSNIFELNSYLQGSARLGGWRFDLNRNLNGYRWLSNTFNGPNLALDRTSTCRNSSHISLSCMP